MQLHTCTNTQINVLENVMVSEGLKKFFFFWKTYFLSELQYRSR